MINKDSDVYNIKRLHKFHLPVICSINQLNDVLRIGDSESKFFFSNNRKKNLYSTFEIKKRDGSSRKIEKPNQEILPVLKALNKSLFSCFPLNGCCCGFVSGKSIVDNAIPHIGCKLLIKLDIKDFFPSINLKKIVYCLRYFGYGKNVSRYIGYLCVNKDYCLPQGFPTSPAISNIVASKLDSRIMGLIKKRFANYELSYSRYADDISISTKKHLSKDHIIEIIDWIYKIMQEEGFTPNHEKTKIFTNGSKLSVTGITVNNQNKPSVDKRIIREIENAIRYSSKYGISDHLKRINNQDRCYSIESYIEHIFGLCAYVKMIDKEKGNKLYKQFMQTCHGT